MSTAISKTSVASVHPAPLLDTDEVVKVLRNPLTMGSSVVPIAHDFIRDRARSERDDGEVEGEVLDVALPTRENDEECSGGETRTLNLAGSLEPDDYQHPLE
jgi:hypothetical protein